MEKEQDDNKLRKFYNVLSSPDPEDAESGPVYNDLPDYEGFRKIMANPTYAEGIYNDIRKNKTFYDFPETFADFRSMVGLSGGASKQGVPLRDAPPYTGHKLPTYQGYTPPVAGAANSLTPPVAGAANSPYQGQGYTPPVEGAKNSLNINREIDLYKRAVGYLKEGQAAADKRIRERESKYSSPTKYAYGANARFGGLGINAQDLVNIQEANKEKDPAKLIGNAVSKVMEEEIKRASEEGISIEGYRHVSAREAEQIADEYNRRIAALYDMLLQQEYVQKQKAGGAGGYIVTQGMRNSFIGKLLESSTSTSEQIRIADLAAEAYKPGAVTKFAAGALALMSDAPLFVGVGSLGKVAAKPMVNGVVKLLAGRIAAQSAGAISEKAAQAYVMAQLLPRLAGGVVSSAVTLGGYDAITDPAQQAKEIKLGAQSGYSPLRTLKEAGKGAALGAAVGAIGATTGMMASKAAAAGGKAAAAGGKAAYAAGEVGIRAGGLAAEIAAFTYGEAYMNGEKLGDVSLDDILQSAMMLGAMKASHVNPVSVVNVLARISNPKKRFGNTKEATESKVAGDFFFTKSEQEDMVRYRGYDKRSMATSIARLVNNPELFERFMADKSVAGTTKLKVIYAKTGEFANQLPYIWGTGAYEADGKFYGYTRDHADNVIERRVFSSAKEAKAWTDKMDDVGRDQNIQDMESRLGRTRIEANMRRLMESSGASLREVNAAFTQRAGSRTERQQQLVSEYYAMLRNEVSWRGDSPAPEGAAGAAGANAIGTEGTAGAAAAQEAAAAGAPANVEAAANPQHEAARSYIMPIADLKRGVVQAAEYEGKPAFVTEMADGFAIVAVPEQGADGNVTYRHERVDDVSRLNLKEEVAIDRAIADTEAGLSGAAQQPANGEGGAGTPAGSPAAQQPDAAAIMAAAPKQKNGSVDFNALIEASPNDFATLWEARSSPDNAKKQLEVVSGNVAEKIAKLQAKAEGSTDLNSIAAAEDEMRDLQAKKQRIDEVLAQRYGQQEEAAAPAEAEPVDEASAEVVPVEQAPAPEAEIQPIGKGAFGNIYDQFKGKPKEAINFLLQRKEGEAIGALTHSQIGDIDLVWGEEGTAQSDGFGLAKIAKYHPEVLDDLQGIIDGMHIKSASENRIRLESETHQAAVRLNWNSEDKKWLLTAYEKETSPNNKTTDTTISSKLGGGDTALSSGNVSVGKSSENNLIDNTHASEKQAAGVTAQDAERLIAAMEQGAEAMPVLELTPESWEAEFGEDGKVDTPIGQVKMGENQLAKLILNKRTGEFGMIKPTLTNPDVIVEEPSEAIKGQQTERPSSYLFIKTFDINGEKIRHFEAVTVSKEGMEVVISNHIIKPIQLMDRLTNGNMLLSRYELHGSDASGEHQGLDGHAAQYPNSNAHGSNPQSNPISTAKGSENNLPDNTPAVENPNEQAPVAQPYINIDTGGGSGIALSKDGSGRWVNYDRQGDELTLWRFPNTNMVVVYPNAGDTYYQVHENGNVAKLTEKNFDDLQEQYYPGSRSEAAPAVEGNAPEADSGSPEARISQLKSRLWELDERRSAFRRKYLGDVKGYDNLEKAHAVMEADPEYQQVEAASSRLRQDIFDIETEGDLPFLEGELPSRLPKKDEVRRIDDEHAIFTKGGGVVNVRPIPQKAGKIDVKKALFSLAVGDKEDDLRPAIKGILHDSENGADVSTDRHAMLVVPASNKKTWIEGRDGKEIDGSYPGWQHAVPDNAGAAKVKVIGLQPLIDQLAGAARADKFVSNMVAVQLDVDGSKALFNPDLLLKAVKAMQGAGSRSAVFEFGGSPGSPGSLVIRDSANPKKFALVMPYMPSAGASHGGPLKDSFGRSFLVVPVALGRQGAAGEGSGVFLKAKRGQEAPESKQPEMAELHQRILTPRLKKTIHDAVEAAHHEGNPIDGIRFDYDREASLFADKLTPDEYKLFSADKAEAVIEAEIMRQASDSGYWENVPKQAEIANAEKPVGANDSAVRLQAVLTPHAPAVQTGYNFDVSGLTAGAAREMQKIKDAAVAGGTFMKAPNGKDSRLNERKWLYVRTNGFKKGFGDWESDPEHSSKVVDENGEPLEVYHGGQAGIDIFYNPVDRHARIGKDKYSNIGNFRSKGAVGIYFTPDLEGAKIYARNVAKKERAIYSCFLNIKNPYRQKQSIGLFGWFKDGVNPQVIKKELLDTKLKGYDGLIWDDYEYIAFNSNQIKSSTDNNGNFDTQNDNIRFQQEAAGMQAEISRAEAEVDAANERFNAELDDFSAGTMKSSDVLHLGKPLEILKSAGLNESEMLLSQSVLREKLKQHGLTTEELKGLAEAIQRPIMVYEWGTKAKSTVIISDLTRANGEKVTVAIAAERKGNTLEVNDVSSIHGKASERFLEDMQNAREGGLKEALRYVDKEKALDWLAMAPPKGASQANQGLNSVANVIENFQNPKLSTEKLQSSGQKMQPITFEAWQKLIAQLQKTGLARHVFTDEASMRDYLKGQHGQRMLGPELPPHLRKMATAKGEVYGFVTPEGNVYLDPKRMNANTPIHEFGHLWNDFVKHDNPELWAKIADAAKETPYFKDLHGTPAYANLKDDARADEAFAQALGDEGERIFNDPNTPKSVKDRFKQLLKDFWAWIGKKLGIRDLSPEQISRLTFEQAVKGAVADITSGKPIASKNLPTLFDKAEKENAAFAAQETPQNPAARFQLALKNQRDFVAGGIGIPESRLATPEQPGTLAKKIQPLGTGFVENFIDNHQRLKNTVKEIERRTGIKIPVKDNPYDRVTAVSTRAQAAIEDFTNRIFAPLARRVGEMAKKLPESWSLQDIQQLKGAADSKIAQLFLQENSPRRVFDLYIELNVCWLITGDGDMLVNEDKSAPSSASLSQFETENGELRGQVKLLKELLKEKERENAQRLQEMGAQSVRANEEAGEVGRKDKAKRKQAAKDVAAM